MFNSFFALIRGRSHESSQAVIDASALTILRQQIRDSAAAVTSAKKAIAVAQAQNDREKQQFDVVVARIRDLETRTVEAIEKGEETLAREAAETIAVLEAERDASLEAERRFDREINRPALYSLIVISTIFDQMTEQAIMDMDILLNSCIIRNDFVGIVNGNAFAEDQKALGQLVPLGSSPFEAIYIDDDFLAAK